jgi:hypothetical protein
MAQTPLQVSAVFKKESNHTGKTLLIFNKWQLSGYYVFDSVNNFGVFYKP